ncbi:MAG: T9SS type A sorting domain-containing protein [Bacteroidetes bacterium]|nr:T9SS type A sorting domain-containing protein [Bacteroidota bacterium]
MQLAFPIKTILLSLLACCCLNRSQAFILSGVVVNSSSGKGVSGQKVYVLDTATQFMDSVFTNASGGYSLHILSNVDTNDLLEIYTYGCGVKTTVTKQFTGATVVANLYICPTLYSLNGTVSLNGALNTGTTRLYLLSRAYDSLKNDSVMRIVDTLYTDSYGGTYNKNFTSIPKGTLMLKAELPEGHPQYGHYMPTWEGQELVWSNAPALASSNFSASVATNISLLPAVGSSGTAAVAGMVTDASISTPKPLEGRLLLLTNSNGVPIAYTRSDSTGQFSFSHIDFGTYKIFGDSWGRLNPALTFTLTAIRPIISDIVFTEDSSSFYGSFGATNVAGNPDTWTAVRLFPNPVYQTLHISGLDQIEGPKNILLYDISGTQKLRRNAVNESEIQLDLSYLSAGVFVLEIQAAKGLAVYRLLKR